MATTENLINQLVSYFKYLGGDASSIFDDMALIDQARLLQVFMDVVEENRFNVDEDSKESHLTIVGDVPADLRQKLTQLLTFYWFDLRMDESPHHHPPDGGKAMEILLQTVPPRQSQNH